MTKKIIKKLYFADLETSAFTDKLDAESVDLLDFQLFCCLEVDEFGILSKYNTKNHDEMVDFFLKHDKGVSQKVFYFHNLTFDSKFFIRQIYERNYRVEIIKVNAKILSIMVYKKNKKHNKLVVKFIDSLSLLLKKVADLGQMLNLPKLNFNYNYSDEQKAIEYCYRDCEIVYRSMLMVLDLVKELFDVNIRLEKIPMTIGSLTKKCFQKEYPKVYYEHDKYLDLKLRKFYFGGRVEVFDYNRIPKAIYLDINSLYPTCLNNYDFCMRSSFRVDSKYADYDYNDFINDTNAIAIECDITEKETYLPYYPSELNEKIVYGLGKKQAFLSKTEVKFLLESGMLNNSFIIHKINAIYYCRDIGNFSKYVMKVYNERKKFPHDSFQNYFWKIFLNNTYGKLGQNPERQTYILDKDIDLSNEKLQIVEKDGIFYQINTYIQEHQTINLINAVLTTNYARMTIFAKMLEMIKLKIPFYYCDTDSLVIADIDLSKIELSKELGKWKVENIMVNFQAIDCKEYSYTLPNNDFVAKFKGLKTKKKDKNGNEINLMDNVSKLKNHYKNGSYNLSIPSAIYCWNRNQPENATFVIPKKKHTFYEKRVIMNNLKTKPANINKDLGIQCKNNEKKIQKVLQNLDNGV